MEIKINLSKVNQRLLKKVIVGVFPDVKKVRFGKDVAKIKRKGLFSKKLTISLAELILISIPKELNTLSKSVDCGEILPYFSTVEESVEYFYGIGDIVEYLYSLYSDIMLSYTLNEGFSEELHSTPKIEVVESKRTRKLFVLAISNYLQRIDEVINTSERPLKVVHKGNSSEVRGPPLRLIITTQKVA